ncbi:MAG: DUF4935 domain-containing protein [Bacteroidales bacterium]|nr:DUF4935 domain-containing protein [Bacteroidales bacterium]
MKLETQNIFLDTSTFEKNNILAGRKIKSLLKHCEEKTIKIFSTQIVINELKERVKKIVMQSKSDWKKYRNEKPEGIFRNTDTISIFEKLWSIDFQKEIEIIHGNIDKVIIKTPIQLIDSDGVDIDLVFEKYFNNEAPFKEGLKKNEFPDAFILATIDLWCSNNNEKMIIVSSDNDWLNYKSDKLIKINELDELLNRIAVHKEIALKERRLQYIENTYLANRTKLEQDLKEYFVNTAYYDTGDADLQAFEILEINWGEYIVTEFEEEYAELKTEITLQINAVVSYEDYESGFYDKEDGKWYFVETVDETITRELILPVTISLSYDMENNDYDINYESINNDKPIDLDYDRFGHEEIYK